MTSYLVKCMPGKGNSLVASRHISKGELIISEIPLLCYFSSESWAQAAQRLACMAAPADLQERAPTWLMQLVCFLRSEDGAAKKLVLAMFAPGDFGNMCREEEQIVQEAHIFAKWVSMLSSLSFMAQVEVPELADVADLDTETIQRIVLIWNCNANSFLGGTALGADHSKINHVCGGRNTCYRSNADQRCGECVAIRDICSGEELTNSYLDGPTGTVERQRLLCERWFFHCNCSYCEEYPDLLAARRCPSCQQQNAKGRQLGEEVWEFLASCESSTFLKFDASDAKARMSLAQDILTREEGQLVWCPAQAQWLCFHCGHHCEQRKLAAVHGKPSEASALGTLGLESKDEFDEAASAIKLQDLRRQVQHHVRAQAAPFPESLKHKIRHLMMATETALGSAHWQPQASLRLLADAGGLCANGLVLAALETQRFERAACGGTGGAEAPVGAGEQLSNLGMGSVEMMLGPWLFRTAATAAKEDPALREACHKLILVPLREKILSDAHWFDRDGRQLALLEMEMKLLIMD